MTTIMNEINCRACKHWKQNTFYDTIENFGECVGIEDSMNGIDIEIEAGWNGGYVGKIETPGNFGCKNFNPQDS